MQSETGCKINVSQASGADIERDIGLVGTRQAIEDAKRAIWEKVDQVVGLFPFSTVIMLMSCSVKRIIAVDVTTVAAVQTEAMITATHNSHSHLPMHTAVLLRRSLLSLQPTRQVVLLLILMLSMVVTRLTSRCGMHRLRNSSSKEGNHPKPDPRLSLARLTLRMLLRPHR
jgi:hypothetical protein